MINEGWITLWEEAETDVDLWTNVLVYQIPCKVVSFSEKLLKWAMWHICLLF